MLKKTIAKLCCLLCFLAALVACNPPNATSTLPNNVQESTMIGDTVPALSDSLWYIYQDKKGNYWFGSNGEGVFRYDGKTILNFTTKHGLGSDSIRQIQEDKAGNMYFSTMRGINKFDGQKITTLQPIRSTDWKLEADDLWFYMLGKKDEEGPYRYDGKNLYNFAFPKHYLHDEFHKNGINPFFSPYEVYCIYNDRKGAMWFGTSVFGLCRFDGQSVKWMYEKDLTIVPAGGSFGIRSIFEDREGSFWICNTQHRYKIDLEATAKSDRLQYQQVKGIGNAKDFGGDPYIYYSYIVEDNNGAIWLTTWDQGVYKYDGKTIVNYPIKDGGSVVNLVSMYKDNQGDLWVGTPDHGAYKFTGAAFERFLP